MFCHKIPASGSLSHTALAVAAESAFSSSEGPQASVQLLATSITGSHKQSFVPQIALAILVLTSKIGVRVRSFWFVWGWTIRQGVAGSVVWWCLYGWGLADFDSFWGGLAPRFVKGVLNQHVGIQPTVFRSSYVFIHHLPRHPWNSSFIFSFLFWICTCVFVFVSCLWTSILIKIEMCIFWIGWTNCGNGWYLSMLSGVYVGIMICFVVGCLMAKII